MFLNVKSAFISLFLISLLCTFYGVNAIAVPKIKGLKERDDNSDLCSGFKFDNPPSEAKGPIQIKNNTEFTASWSTESGSELNLVSDFELFSNGTDGKLVTILWEGAAEIKDNKASATFSMYAPEGITLPATFFARSWASTPSGPNCFSVSRDFTIVEDL
ncbi:hypothetical protein C2G38_2034128 [Gigaspora rosea]|uniref:Uncharacterized protein n=1 Tax=Gigaspora rosea TaxID=44941 RepID=A0A397VKA3_9GLOM|nr:hypothetical protein C2G38_2034128 [Gigaspora rosea]CAG8461310.1 5287_t:CDS:2 [Gigaspora rosea]